MSAPQPESAAPPGIRHAPAEGAAHAEFARLRRRLRWQLLLVYVAPLVLLAGYFHLAYAGLAEESVRNHLLAVAEHQRNTVDLFLRERVANVRGAFHSAAMPLPPASGVMDRLLEELQQASPSFVDLGLFSPDNRLVAYAGPHVSLLGRDYSSQPWLVQLRQDPRDFVISDVFLGFRGRPHFIIAVGGRTDHPGWLLRASVDPQSFAEFVASSYLLKGAEALIVNPQGHRQTLRATDPPEGPRVDVPVRAPDTHVAEVELGEKKYLRVVAWLTENDWALVVQVPLDQAYASTTRTRLVSAGILLVALLMILAVVVTSTRRLVARLEGAVSARDALTYQLFNAAKLASVGEMAAGVAHEINNPLAIIYEEASMMVDVLDPQFGQTIDRDDFHERLKIIQEATMRGRTITGKLLAFSRRHDPEPEPSDLSRLAERVLAVREHEYQLANIGIVRGFADDLPLVLVNRNLMDQVVLNLLNNARDAIVATGAAGRIEIRTRCDGDHVLLDVTDTGCGMSPQVMARIFTPFFTTKSVGKGTGLGLSISYRIVESFGGRIHVHSEEGRGSIFTVSIPVPGKAAHREHEGAAATPGTG